MKLWTATTDGDNCELTTTAHRTREEAEARVRADLWPVEQDAGPVDSLRYAWESAMDGACIIQEHEL